MKNSTKDNEQIQQKQQHKQQVEIHQRRNDASSQIKNNSNDPSSIDTLADIQNTSFITSTLQLSISYITLKNWYKAKECLDEILSINSKHSFTFLMYDMLYIN